MLVARKQYCFIRDIQDELTIIVLSQQINKNIYHSKC